MILVGKVTGLQRHEGKDGTRGHGVHDIRTAVPVFECDTHGDRRGGDCFRSHTGGVSREGDAVTLPDSTVLEIHIDGDTTGQRNGVLTREESVVSETQDDTGSRGDDAEDLWCARCQGDGTSPVRHHNVTSVEGGGGEVVLGEVGGTSGV